MTRPRGGLPQPAGEGSLSDEDVERRLGGGAGIRVTRVRRRRVDSPARPDARAMLVRDTGTILAAAAITVLVWQLVGAGPVAPGTTSEPPIGTGIGAGSAGATATLAPFETLGPIANSSIGLGATPTPVPFTTLGPTQLKVVVDVTNDNGGNNVASAWTVTVGGVTASPSVFAGSATGTTVTISPTTTFTISVKSKNAGGYTEARSGNCTGPVAKGATATCTIAENDKPVTMMVQVRGASGVKVTVTAAGVDHATFTGVAAGTLVHFNANARWSITTTPSSIANYTRTNTASCSSTTGVAEGASVSCTFTFTANPSPSPTPKPTAAFTCTSLGGGTLTVSFTNDSTGLQSSWSWDFGDSVGVSTAQSPADYTYAAAGTYPVTLTVTGPGGQDTVSHSCTAS